MDRVRVLVIGAAGRMGREVVKAVSAQGDMVLAAAVDRGRAGEGAARVAGLETPSVPITASLVEALAEASPDVAVDFTIPESVKANVQAVLRAKVACVVGATGLKQSDLDELGALCEEMKTPCLVAPNFAIGAVLMMQFAQQAARYFDSAEIIELHHATKVDAPSGTALRTARLIADSLCRAGVPLGEPSGQPTPAGSATANAARGQSESGIPIHSVRLPGLVAHQEVIFGGLGQTLTIRHDSTSRESFMPGVLLAIRKVRGLRGLVVGLEKIL
jgi:4-hydroxy-tetrahydrodipicolinate reductase